MWMSKCGFCNIGLQLPNLSFEKNATATSQFSKIGKVSIHGTWTILNYLGYKYQPSFPLFETESPLTYRHRMFKPGKTKCYHYMITIQSWRCFWIGVFFFIFFYFGGGGLLLFFFPLQKELSELQKTRSKKGQDKLRSCLVCGGWN